jgi:hypothetical protein
VHKKQSSLCFFFAYKTASVANRSKKGKEAEDLKWQLQKLCMWPLG